MSSVNGRPDILTSTGQYFNFLHPEQNIISIIDIGHGLSNCCRFAGQCRQFYSVAQHSVMMSYLVPAEHALAGLLHDCDEAYILDMPKPLKNLLPDYQAMQSKVAAAALSAFGILLPLPKVIKEFDLVLLCTEQRDLMATHTDEWAILRGVKPLERTIVPWPPERAFNHFMDRFNELAPSEMRVSFVRRQVRP